MKSLNQFKERGCGSDSVISLFGSRAVIFIAFIVTRLLPFRQDNAQVRNGIVLCR